MKLSELKKIINQIDSREDITSDPEVVFQGNEQEADEEDEGTPNMHTSCLGSVYSVWFRKAGINGPAELVIDCVITESGM